MEDKVLLDVQGLKTYFHTFKGVVKAVDNVSFSLKEGEILGIVGESGSGKSVTSFSILKLVEDPGVVDADHIMFDGKDLAKISERDMSKIRGKDISMVFQDPMTSLNPLYTIQRQMEEVLILHEPQMNKAQRRERCIELLHAVGIPNPEERLKEYPNQFSGGMRQRVIIAIALATNPKLLIADEPTTALDVTIQEQILKLMKKLVKEHNTSLMLITHDLAVVSQMVDKINVMYCGKLVETGKTEDIIYHNAHPYTEGLLNSIPKLYEDRDRLDYIPGMVPNMFELPEGLTTIGYQCFKNCFADGVDAKVIIPASVATLGEGAFYDEHITQIIFEKTVDPWKNEDYSGYANSAITPPSDCDRIIVLPDNKCFAAYSTQVGYGSKLQKICTYPIKITFSPLGKQEQHLNHALLGWTYNPATNAHVR